MTSRRLSNRRLDIIRAHLTGRYSDYMIVGEIGSRLIQEIDALRTERDALASAILNHDGARDWPEGIFEVAERVLNCRVCRGCGEELEWINCIYCHPIYADRYADDMYRIPPGVTCPICNGARGEWEPCGRCARPFPPDGTTSE